MSDQLCLMCRLHPSRRPYCKDCRIAKLEAELDDLKLAFVDCLKSRSQELRNVEAERDRLREEIYDLVRAGRSRRRR